MGVPKFFRWLSERYPKMNQRHGCSPSADLIEEHFGDSDGASDSSEVVEGVNDGDGSNDGDNDSPSTSITSAAVDGNNNAGHHHVVPPPSLFGPDPLSTCGLKPEIDRLYVDMNGIIHGCSHSNYTDENEDEPDDDSDDVSSSSPLQQDQIVRNVCYYLDRIVSEVAQPHELLYLAVDGVAPRAKLNQQRGRRYRNGKEGEIERTIYDAYLESTTTTEPSGGGDADPPSQAPRTSHHHHSLHPEVKQVEPGRYAGKFETAAATVSGDEPKEGTFLVEEPTTDDGDEGEASNASQSTTPPSKFHSVEITPGTPFLFNCSLAIRAFVEKKLETDPNWKHLTVVYSGPDVPGEGEHKIMDFIRDQKYGSSSHDYDPNLRHCIMGQDGDLILLGLVTHEPNLMLLRERVLFDKKLRKFQNWLERSTRSTSSNDGTAANNNNKAVDFYMKNSNFEFLHMNVLRDYLALEFGTSNVTTAHNSSDSRGNKQSKSKSKNNKSKKSNDNNNFEYDLERTIDDFVFLTFFVGNDFLPHMPALDIADEALDFLIYAYKEQRQHWINDDSNINGSNNNEPYLTKAGTIVSGKRLESFLKVIGEHETKYYEYKQSKLDLEQLRMYEQKYGMATTPADNVLEEKELFDRHKYRQMMLNNLALSDEDDIDNENDSDYDDFQPVMTTQLDSDSDDSDDDDGNDNDARQQGYVAKMGHLLEASISSFDTATVSSGEISDAEADNKAALSSSLDDQDMKGRYYYDKFGFTPFDVDKHQALRRSYIEGLVWNLKYYYQGCVSWNWYYPYHYGPMISDLINLDEILEDIEFGGTTDNDTDSHCSLGSPLRPFEQLMACLPPSHANLLPKPYQHLMTSDQSPLAQYYPQSFVIDMNGKRLPWEAVILLPFIDTNDLLNAINNDDGISDNSLSDAELKRNELGTAIVLSASSSTSETAAAGGVNAIPFESSSFYVDHSSNEQQHERQLVVFRPEILNGSEVPLPGFPTLLDGTIASMWRKRIRINVHGSKSRYKTACLELKSDDVVAYGVVEKMIPIEFLAKQLIGTFVYINYPHYIPAFVTAVSDSRGIIQGQQLDHHQESKHRPWNTEEASERQVRLKRVLSQYVFGDGHVGSGGVALASSSPPVQKKSSSPGGSSSSSSDGRRRVKMNDRASSIAMMEELDVLLYVRPMQGLKTIAVSSESEPSSESEAIKGQYFAKFEMEVPLFVTSWMPKKPDHRLMDVPVLMEKDPYKVSRHNNLMTQPQPGQQQQHRKKKKKKNPISTSFSSSHPPPKLAHAAGAARSFHSFAANSTSSAIVVDTTGPLLPLFRARQSLQLPSTSTTTTPYSSQFVVSGMSNCSLLAPASSALQRKVSPVALSPRRLRVTAVIAERTVSATTRGPAAVGGGRSVGLQRVAVLGAVLALNFFSSFTQISAANGNLWGTNIGVQSPVLLTTRPDVMGSVAAAVSTSQGNHDGYPFLDRTQVKPLEFEHGTTTLAFTFDGGIIVAVDSRASIGNFVGSKTTHKVLPIHSHLLGTMAGGAADCMYWIRKLKAEAMLHELQDGGGKRMSVARASRLLSNYLYEYRGLGLSMGTMIAGYDDYPESPPKIYYVSDTGIRIESDMFAVGSGSTYALGVLDCERRPGMSTDDAIALAIKAIRHATFRDAASGGYINVYLISRDSGWTHVFTEDLARLVSPADNEDTQLQSHLEEATP